MTIIEDIQKAETYFNKAAKAWVRGNNSGDNDILEQCDKLSDKHQNYAESLLSPYGITVDYPGLYPVYHYKNMDYYTVHELIEAIRKS